MNPQEWTSLEIVAEGEDVEDEDEVEEDEDDDGDDDDEDEDDDVGTDERGQEILKAPETAAEPDVSSDRRVPAAAVSPGDASANSAIRVQRTPGAAERSRWYEGSCQMLPIPQLRRSRLRRQSHSQYQLKRSRVLHQPQRSPPAVRL